MVNPILRLVSYPLSGQALQDSRLEVVDHDLGRHAMAEELKRVLMAGEEVLHGQGDGIFEG